MGSEINLFPVVDETKLFAVAEVYSSTLDIESVPSIICTDRQRSAVVLEEKDRLHLLEHSGVDQLADPIGRTSDLEPLEHSFPKVPLDREGELSDSCPGVHREGARDGRRGLRDLGVNDG